MTPCAAAIPWLMLIGDDQVNVWQHCGAPAAAVHRYACMHEHVEEKATCDQHAPEPDSVGCRQCFDAGHECPMVAELIEALI